MILDVVIYVTGDLLGKKIKSLGPKPFIMVDDGYLCNKHYELISNNWPFSHRFIYVAPYSIVRKFRKVLRNFGSQAELITYEGDLDVTSICKIGLKQTFSNNVLFLPCNIFYDDEFLAGLKEGIQYNKNSQVFLQYAPQYGYPGAILEDGKVIHMSYNGFGAFSGIALLKFEQQQIFGEIAKPGLLHENINRLVEAGERVYPSFLKGRFTNINNLDNVVTARGFCDV